MRWLEINGNSGSGKSSHINADLLPLVEQGLLWMRARYEHCYLIGPMMPGEHPVEMLAELLVNVFGQEMSNVCEHLEVDNDHSLSQWLRGRKRNGTAFLLATDQFEGLSTFADPGESRSSTVCSRLPCRTWTAPLPYLGRSRGFSLSLCAGPAALCRGEQPAGKILALTGN